MPDHPNPPRDPGSGPGSRDPGSVWPHYFRVADLIERRLQHDPAFRRRVLERSEYYKSGVDYCTPPTELKDIDACAKGRYHAKLHRPAQPGEEHHVRMCGLFNADDVEVKGVPRA